MVEQIPLVDAAAVRLTAPAAPRPGRSAQQPAAVEAPQGRVQAQQAPVMEVQPEAAQPVPEQDEGALEQAFQELNTFMDRLHKSIRFDVYDDSGTLYAQVIDTSTDEVIRTIPSEEALAMMSRVNEVLGLLIDERG